MVSGDSNVNLCSQCLQHKNCRKRTENESKTIENFAENDRKRRRNDRHGAETKHLNSTRTARPFGGPGSSSRIQMLRFGDVFNRNGAEMIENGAETIEIGAETIENGRRESQIAKIARPCRAISLLTFGTFRGGG